MALAPATPPARSMRWRPQSSYTGKMKTLYLDIFSGISGDMLIGALIDLGVDGRRLEKELAKLPLEGYHLHVTRGNKANIEGGKFDVHLPSHAHEHAHGDATTHSHAHSHQNHAEGHHHGAHGGPLVLTSTGQIELSVFETNVPPRFRLYFCDGKGKPVAPAAATRGAKSGLSKTIIITTTKRATVTAKGTNMAGTSQKSRS